MIPSTEVNALHRDAGTAVTLALSGQAEGGLEVLLSGLQRARRLRTASGWAAELTECYDMAVAGFCRRYGVSTPPRAIPLEALDLAST
jgi:hypothetical protein